MSRWSRYVVMLVADRAGTVGTDLTRALRGGGLDVEIVDADDLGEAEAVLVTGRAVSAVVVTKPRELDRDFIALADRRAARLFVVDDGRTVTGWTGLGVALVLPQPLDGTLLGRAVRRHCRVIGPALPPAVGAAEAAAAEPQGKLIAIIGSGGSGASTIATAVAQGLGLSRSTLLADFGAGNALAALHGLSSGRPGLLDLVDAHRRAPRAPDVLAQLVRVQATGGYDLLPGLARRREWINLRPVAFDAALATMTVCYRLTVADIAGDIEGEIDTGSVDVEERNHVARTTALAADVVGVVTRPGITGRIAGGRLLDELADLGVEPARIVEITNLVDASAAGPAPSGPDRRLLVPRFEDLSARRADRQRYPAAMVDLLAAGLGDALRELPATARPGVQPVPVEPGSLPLWSPRP